MYIYISLQHHQLSVPLYPLAMPPAIALSYPNQWCPTQEWTLRKFHQTARTYLHADCPDALDYFLKLVLAGQALDEQGKIIRVHLIPEDDTPFFDSLDGAVAVRDFDSLLGVSNDLPFVRSFSIFPVPSFRDTLVKNNHLHKTIRQPVNCLHFPYDHILIFLTDMGRVSQR
jgi:hypothetical protein